MEEILAYIETVDECQIEELLEAVLRRYAVIHPQWELSTFSVRRESDRNEQINKMICMLETIKDTH